MPRIKIFHTSNVVALLLCVSSVLALNKTFDSIFPLPISLIILTTSAFLHCTSYQRKSLKPFLLFLTTVYVFSAYHFLSGSFSSVDRLLVLTLMSFCIYSYIQAPQVKTEKLCYALAQIFVIFLYANLIFGLLQILGVIDPFSFSKSHMHGFAKIAGINRNSFIFSEPSYNVVAITLSFLLINATDNLTLINQRSVIYRHRYFIITLVTLLTTLSVTGFISILLLMYHQAKIKNIRTYLITILSVITITVLQDSSAFGAVFARITHLISNPQADARLYDHYISLTCDRDVWAWLFGMGLGNWFDFVSGCSDYIIHKTSNSILADYIVEAGLIGIIGILLVYTVIFKNIKLVIILLVINLFFQLHLSAIGVIAFLLCRTGKHKNL